MARPKIDKAREDRIDEEIIVDCYGEAERAMGWYYYLEDRLEFPFTAKCTVGRSISPRKFNCEVQHLGEHEKSAILSGHVKNLYSTYRS